MVYLTKPSKPDITNAVRELSKSMDKLTPSQYKEMVHMIKKLLESKGKGLKVNTIAFLHALWTLQAFRDTNWGADKDTTTSVYGIPIAWKSQGMKSVVLFSTEAECIGVSEVVREIQFVIQLLHTNEFKVDVYNVGEIWIANNNSSGERTRHIDTRARFIKGFVLEGVIDIVFVMSAHNDSDLLT